MKKATNTITQRALAKRLGLKPPKLCRMLKGKVSASADEADKLEKVSGIGIRMWLYRSNHVALKEALELVYGTINFKRGRLPGKSGDKKNV